MKIEELYREIVSLEDLKPSKKVDFLFSKLVSKVIDSSDLEVLSKKKCKCLQKICAHAEYELEKHWAQKIISGNKSLKDFPYLKNYEDLTRLEWQTFHACSEHHKHKVLFIGSGPLPMTAIILATEYGVSSTLVDNNPEAVRFSKELIHSLGLENKINTVYADGGTFIDVSRFNVIFVAALAGVDPRKKNSIFENIKNNAPKDSHIIARSSWGKREMLYAPLSRDVDSFFDPIIEIKPHNDIVNSFFVFKNSK